LAVAWSAKDPDGIGAPFAGDADFVHAVDRWRHRKQRIWTAHAIGLRTFFCDSILMLE